MKAYVCLSALLLSGCSVGMALSGSDNPDLSVVKSGASRGEIEMQLGSPVTVSSVGNGLEAATYKYEHGNEPSAGRAVFHGAADVITLGLWELASTPIEAVQGETRTVIVTYDQSDTATAVRGH